MYRINIVDILDGGKLSAIRALRSARITLGGESSFRAVTDDVNSMLDGDQLIVVGDTDSRDIANQIAAALQTASCIVQVDEIADDAGINDEDEQWGAVPRAALVLMAAANGDPSLALGFAKSLGYNTDDPDLYDEVADLLRQAFPPEIPR